MRQSILALMFMLLVTACGGGSNGTSGPDSGTDGSARNVPLEQLNLGRFAADCRDFIAYAADALTEQFLTPVICPAFAACPVFGIPEGGFAEDNTAGQPVVAGGAGASPPDRVSGTNVQEAGVDEADIVKVDAQGRIFVLSGRHFHSLNAFPPQGLESRPLSSLELADADSNFFARDFMLDEDNALAVVFGDLFDLRDGNRAVTVIVDVADPASMTETLRLTSEGFGISSRRIERRVHRVTSFNVPRPEWFFDASDSLAEQRRAYDQARADGETSRAESIKVSIRNEIANRVAQAGAQSFLPETASVVAGVTLSDGALACDDVSRPEVTTGLGLVLIDSFNTDGSNRGTTGIINNAQTVYASSENLYLAQTSFGWWFADNQAEETALYRFALSDTGAARFDAYGKASGSIRDSFSLSEFGAHLRVVTTERRLSDAGVEPVNHLTTLSRDASGVLMTRGEISAFAPGETVQGVRFDGDRAFVVTFRNIDPLFAMDLSDAENPRILDELKIPGFSSYLMPLGNDFLLTIGRAGDDEALNGRVGIQLFDVSDLTDIRQTAVIEPTVGDGGFSWSTAEYDPHAFAYFSDSADVATPGTLSVPLQAFASDDRQDSFSGFLVVRVDPLASQALTEIGRISHEPFAHEQDACRDGEPDVPCFDSIHQTEPLRAVFAQDENGTYLYSISSLGIIASDALAPESQIGRKALIGE